MQEHAVVSLPNSAKPWRRDLVCPPPLGRDAFFPIVSFQTPIEERWTGRQRSDLVTSCHLELALAALGPPLQMPFQVQLNDLSDDGDGFAMALHAASLAQWAIGMRSMQPPVKQPHFAAFSVASTLLASISSIS